MLTNYIPAVGAVMPRHGDWQLEAAGIGGDGVGVSTEAAHYYYYYYYKRI